MAGGCAGNEAAARGPGEERAVQQEHNARAGVGVLRAGGGGGWLGRSEVAAA